MKAFKILYLGFCTVLLSCSGGEYFGGDDIFSELYYDAADVHFDNNVYFTPPEWIIGTWERKDKLNPVGFIKFTEYDVVFYSYKQYVGWESYSYNRSLNRIEFNRYDRVLIEEVATDTTYFFRIKDRAWSKPHDYSFQKISKDSIIYLNPSFSVIGNNRYGRD